MQPCDDCNEPKCVWKERVLKAEKERDEALAAESVTARDYYRVVARAEKAEKERDEARADAANLRTERAAAAFVLYGTLAPVKEGRFVEVVEHFVAGVRDGERRLTQEYNEAQAALRECPVCRATPLVTDSTEREVEP
jgi:hypothetical protein